MSTEHEREAMGRVERRIDEIVTIISEVRERVARIEGMAVNTTIDALRIEIARAETRIERLEASHHERIGIANASRTWGEWIARLAPWVISIAAATWAYVKFPAS